MSKPNPAAGRPAQFDARYLHKVFLDINSGIKTPPSLRAEYMRHKLDGVSQEKRRLLPALSFLGSRVLSLQSVVSYALAFIVIAVVAYTVNRGSPDIIEGVVPIQTEPESIEAMTYTEPAPGHDGGFDTNPGALSDSDTDNTQDTNTEKQDDPPGPDAAAPFGGGGESIMLAQDGGYYFLYRQVDVVGSMVEIVSMDDDSLAAQITLEDMTDFGEFFLTDTGFAVIGHSGGDFAMKIYSIDRESAAFSVLELCTVVMPGPAIDARLADNYLRAVYVYDSDGLLELPPPHNTVFLPDADEDSSAVCAVATVDTKTGDYNISYYIGGNEGNRVNMQNRSIYISYPVDIDDSEKTELYMVQLSLHGLEPEMMLVP